MIITGMNSEYPLYKLQGFFNDALMDVRMKEVKFFNCGEEDDDVSLFDLENDKYEWPLY